MKPFFLFILFIFNINFISAQIFNVESIKFSGDTDKRINLVILSDGYQMAELDDFILDATNFTNDLFSQSPFLEYANYFNVYAIKVPSNESGADHPGTGPATDETNWPIPITTVDTYFNATFDSFGNHFLLFYEIDENNVNNTQAIISNVLASNFPMYDQALILVNSAFYGGSGGEFSMASTGISSNEIAIHELGHSLFDLKDEYYPGDDLTAEAVNMTQETNASLVKWENWMGINGIGIYQHTGSVIAETWYKPRHEECKMELLNKPFCSVCKEGIIEKIHDMISPIDSYSPVSNSITATTYPIEFKLNLIKTIPNNETIPFGTIVSSWVLNSSNLVNNVDTVSLIDTDLNIGTNTLTVVVNDATTLLMIDNHATTHVYTVTWTITKSALGIDDITSEENTLSITLFPNPANTVVNLKLESTKDLDLKVDVISLDGKLLKTTTLSNYQNQQLDISDLSTGMYLTNFYLNNILIASKRLVKN